MSGKIACVERGPPQIQVIQSSQQTQEPGFLWKCMKSCCSNMGLLVILIGLCVLGGFLFMHLETDNEKRDCEHRFIQFSMKQKTTVDKLLTIKDQNLDQQDTAGLFEDVLMKFGLDVVNTEWEGTNCSMMGEDGGPAFMWSWAGATMFSVTVLTTVGYGHIAPKTYWGKMVCIAYALLGIPLMLLFLANIGDVLADFFKFFYSKICCCGCCRRKDKHRVEEVDNTPRNPNAWRTETSGEPQPPAKAGPLIIEDDEDDDEDFDDDNITIPLTVTLGVIFLYIMLGSVLFGIWENWKPADAAYFCFVTLSTIGFGDFVPGRNNFEDPATQVNMIMGAVYMIFGMAIISMCFSLIQDEIAAKFKWLGTKLGLIDNKTSDDSE